jgi:hypothetical protein
MSHAPLTPEPADRSERIYQALRRAAAEDLRGLADLLASKPDHELLGRTEFEVRDRVHQIGAKALETALEERKKGGTKGPAGPVRIVTSPPGSSSIDPRRSRASWGRSPGSGPLTTAGPAARASSPGTRPSDCRRRR